MATSSVAQRTAISDADKGSGFKFIRVFLGWLFAILFAYLLAITVIDPYREFGFYVFPQTGSTARSDKLHLFQPFLTRGPVTGLIFGSSRVMTLPPAEFNRLTHERFFNAGVFNGFPEDYLAMYRVLRDRGARPKLVVIGVDDDHLDDVRGFDKELEANYVLRSQIDRSVHGVWGFILHRAGLYKQSLSTIFVSNAMQSVSLLLRPKAPPYTLAADGLMNLNPAAANKSFGVDLLDNMNELSPRRIGFLETLIREAQSAGATVILFTTPYRPAALAAVHSDRLAWSHHEMAVGYLLSLQQKYGISTHDYTDEASFGGSPDDWFDQVHYGYDNAARLASTVIRNGF